MDNIFFLRQNQSRLSNLETNVPIKRAETLANVRADLALVETKVNDFVEDYITTATARLESITTKRTTSILYNIKVCNNLH